MIEAHARYGCPAWPVPMGHIWVPRLQPERDGLDCLRAGVVDALRTGVGELAWRSPHARAETRKLLAAAYRDIGDTPIGTLHAKLGIGGDESATKRAAREGRELWARLRVWPWLALDGKAPPPEWWLLDHVVWDWQSWCDPRAWEHHGWVGPRPEPLSAAS